MALKPTTVPTKRLQASITASATSFRLSDTNGWDGAALAASDFGSPAYCIFRNATNTQIEIMEFDPTTITSSSITILRRGLDYTGDISTEDSSRSYSWTRGTLVELGTHAPQIFQWLKEYIDTAAISGGVPASTTALGFAKVSVAPVLSIDPIAVGDNDPRVPTTGEKSVLTNLSNALLPYAADAVGTDAYAVTLSPVPSGYANGMAVKFKASVANTGPATLNVNGLGAIAITKYNDQPLQTGDIEANQIVTVTYNSTGPVFQMDSHVAAGAVRYASGTISRALNGSSGAVTTAHGLGITPKRIKLTGYYAQSTDFASSSGTYDGTTVACAYALVDGAGASTTSGTSSTNILYFDNGGNSQAAVPTMDATNITLTWTKGGSGGGTIQILWEAFLD